MIELSRYEDPTKKFWINPSHIISAESLGTGTEIRTSVQWIDFLAKETPKQIDEKCFYHAKEIKNGN